jgi:hypothetical protein
MGKKVSPITTSQLRTLHWTENEKKQSFIFFSLFDLKMGHSADKFFFLVGNQIFLFNNPLYNIMQLSNVQMVAAIWHFLGHFAKPFIIILHRFDPFPFFPSRLKPFLLLLQNLSFQLEKAIGLAFPSVVR